MTGKRKEINYETLLRISEAIGSARDSVDVCHHVIGQLTDTLELKGCAILLFDRGREELEVAASAGLSQDYLDKGPLSATQSIAASLTEGPVAIFDVTDDPRLQYPKQAVAEGIKSILSVPMMANGHPLGALRLYTSEPWEFTHQDFAAVMAIAQMIALVLDNLRISNAYKKSVEVLKLLRPVIRPRRRTLYE